ncbi:MAG TPA: hypothetical protein EYP65_04145, partial [Armatimonadetes bacterium]|nr:hypothetical protein [Armatimonadota bacterium]
MSARPGSKGGRRPNLLFIITDQQRKNAMGAYANPIIRTPNMDRLAREGMKFEGMFIAAFPCSPSRASFLTGLYHHEHKVFINDLVLNPRIPNLGEVLKRAGYITAWMGKWHLAGPYEPVCDERGKPIG